jgi:predicted porin
MAMKKCSALRHPSRLRDRIQPAARRRLAWTGVTLAVIFMAKPAFALEFGPDNMFFISGFAKAEVVRATNQCPNCQWEPGEDKQRQWADAVIPGAPVVTKNQTLTLFQPYLGAKVNLPNGFKLSGLLSQRWRDGSVDIPGYWYEANIALSHEEYGSLRVGSMTTRAWSISDYPYGTNINLAFPWASSGAGYGLLQNAIRYTSRLLDVADGDLVLEATYSFGNTDFKTNKPSFLELWAQYRRGDLVVDTMYQNTRNGTPSAWGQGPFTGLTYNPADDSKLGGSGQGILLAMARYQVDSKIEISGGIRYNWWSGAYAVVTQPGIPAQWNSMFNVDWGGTRNGVPNPGYSATSTDVMAGARYRMGKWVASAGAMRLGKASTSNPSERGQSNTEIIGALGLSYEFGNGLILYGMAGGVIYGQLGLSPMSSATNSGYTGVDSRVRTSGNWAGLGATYTF